MLTPAPSSALILSRALAEVPATVGGGLVSGWLIGWCVYGVVVRRVRGCGGGGGGSGEKIKRSWGRK